MLCLYLRGDSRPYLERALPPRRQAFEGKRISWRSQLDDTLCDGFVQLSSIDMMLA